MGKISILIVLIVISFSIAFLSFYLSYETSLAGKIIDSGEEGGGNEENGVGNFGGGDNYNANVESSNFVAEIAGEKKNENSCMLIRPGNLPSIFCSVNYIKQNEVSLKIKNDLGEDIGIIMDLGSCSKESGSILNYQNTDFLFSCENTGAWFNKDITIIYIVSSGRVEIGGFVSGEVEQ